MTRKNIFAILLAIALFAGMLTPAYATTNPFAAMEARSRQAVEAAIRAGTVPEGTTIYDCEYGADSNGVTIVIRYRDKNGNWIDAATQRQANNESSNAANSVNQPSAPTSSASNPTEAQLQEYAVEVYRLVNEERQKAGLAPVVWDDDFALCARIRSEELQYRYSHYRPVAPTAGRDRWPALTNGKPGVYNCPSVADEQGVAYTWVWENIAAQRSTPEAAVKAWMDSQGHRDNILKESHVLCGVGVFYTEQASPEGYNWYWTLWLGE